MKTQIAVLDGYTLTQDDLSWEGLTELGDCTIYDRTRAEQIIPRAREAQIVLTNKVLFLRETINQLPNLRYLGVNATGIEIVDLPAARARGIVVTNVPHYSTDSVAQMVFAHLLNLTQRVGDHANAVREGKWAAAPDWCFWEGPLTELTGLTLGIVGLGDIGRAVARLADAFGMRVIATTRSRGEVPDYVELVNMETLFREADVVSLHCPLTPETCSLINSERLAMMKPTAFLINTARGPLVDEQALSEALRSGKLAGAGLDVLATEPPAEDHSLVGAPNCFVTPHLAWATRSSRARLLQVAVENVASYLTGNPQNVVS